MDRVLEGKHILVTGASSGIGRECAKVFSTCGASVSAVARRKDLLDGESILSHLI